MQDDVEMFTRKEPPKKQCSRSITQGCNKERD